MLLRDSLYTTAWFGLMTVVWFGWAQGAPPARLRVPLIVGSGIGLAVAVGFGVLTVLHWGNPTALEGHYEFFGIIVAAEFGFAGAGALAIVLTGHGRWVAWWVALVVVVHFLSLAWIFHGPSFTVLGVTQVVALGAVALLVRAASYPTSRWVGPVMGSTILLYALANGILELRRLAST